MQDCDDCRPEGRAQKKKRPQREELTEAVLEKLRAGAPIGTDQPYTKRAPSMFTFVTPVNLCTACADITVLGI